MAYIISGLLIFLFSLLLFSLLLFYFPETKVWGAIGTVIGAYLIIKDRKKAGFLNKNND